MLPLGLAAGGFADLLFVFAAGVGAGDFGGGFFAGGALDLFALGAVGDWGGIGHKESLSWILRCAGALHFAV